MNTIASLLYFNFVCDKAARTRYLSLFPGSNSQKAMRHLRSALEAGDIPSQCVAALSAIGVSDAVIEQGLKAFEVESSMKASIAFKPVLQPRFSLVDLDQRASHVPVHYRGCVQEAEGITRLPSDIGRLAWSEQEAIVLERSFAYRRFYAERVNPSAKSNYFGRLIGFTYCLSPSQIFEVSRLGRIQSE